MTTTRVDPELMTLLTNHRALGHAPKGELEWLVAHGERHRYPLMEVVNKANTQAKELIVFFTGYMVVRMDRGAGSHKIYELRGGDVGGILPFSRGAAPPTDALAEEPIDALIISKEHFPELIRECPVVTAACVHAMLDRARQFKMSDLRDEKLLSLGRLASGLAHELNNPSSAVVRSAKMLASSIEESEEAARVLHAARLTEDQLAALEGVRTRCVEAAAGQTAQQTAEHLSPLARADREDAIASWLDAHGADASAAATLSESSVPLESLDDLASKLEGKVLDAALRWIAAGCKVRAISSEIQIAASRIHEIVGAVKGFSYMDHAPTPEPVDVSRGIADTLTMLASKIRAKSVHVEIELAPGFPRALGVGAELNQVWMNLLDNAMDAVSNGGSVAVKGTHELDKLVVRVIDDGPGIPAEIRERIFEPFFTTKGVGKGTGLGLDMVRRIVSRHEGDISIESKPGRTEFIVRLPSA